MHNNGLSWTALIAAILALIFSILAYNRAGTDLGEQVAAEIQEAQRDIRLAAERAAAATRLAAIRAREGTQENINELQQDLAEVRTDLRQAYQAAEREASQEFRELDRDLEQAEQNLRSNTADALTPLDRAITNLRQDIRTDDQQ